MGGPSPLGSSVGRVQLNDAVRGAVLPLAIGLLFVVLLKYILGDSYRDWILPLLMAFRALGLRDLSRNGRIWAALAAIVWAWSARDYNGFLALLALGLSLASFIAGSKKPNGAAST